MDSKKIILQMLKDGRITEDEALSLLDSIKDTGRRAHSMTDEEISKIISSLSTRAKIIGKKTYDYLKEVDYNELRDKADIILDNLAKAIDDFKMKRM